MNKFVIVGIVLVLILVGGVVYSMFADNFNCEPGVGEDRAFTIVSKKLEWHFEPDEIQLNQCDRVKLRVVNEDNFDHGFAIDAFGISQRLPANGTIDVDFVATKSGVFPFYCSVSCSDSSDPSFGLKDGVVQSGQFTGVFRGHFEHVAEFIVKSIEVLTPGTQANQ